MVTEIKSIAEFNEVTSTGAVLVDFFATWCGPCKMLAPQLEEFSKDSDVKVVKVNVDEFKDIAVNFCVMSLPTLMLFQNGEVIRRTVGFKRKNELELFVS
jgi:thioredoxin 1